MKSLSCQGALNPPESGTFTGEQSTVQDFLKALDQIAELEKSRDELLLLLKELSQEIDEKERKILSFVLPKEGRPVC
ncbi:hypothetical protein WJR50_33045 [Catalinimonas sp. 4WD22]|uniref:hypothetical protein n=1 Tax=Catalinimonas locisalis TaxID=3133978 RepID=UPI0031012AF2